MKKYLIVFIFMFFGFQLSAQQLKSVAQVVQQSKQVGGSFTDVSGLIEVRDSRPELPEIIDPSKISVFQYQYQNFKEEVVQKSLKTLSISIPLAVGNTVVAEVVEVPESFYLYEVKTPSGTVHQTNSEARYYRGVIREHFQESVVALSFFENEMRGIISVSGHGTYTIGKLKNSPLHIIYEDSNATKTVQYRCETKEDSVGLPYDSNHLFQSNRNSTAAKCIQIYFETEFDIFQHYGSVTGVENYVVGLFNEVATLYQNEDITIEISEIMVWDVVDPYVGTNTESNLAQFQNEISGFNGDLGQLLTFRSMGGRAAGFQGLCNANQDESLSVSGNLETTFPNVPAYSWSVEVVAHEFGHLFGSRHTHACVWNGNNTGIDSCSPFGMEGGCDPPGIPSAGGTIMSYCHLATFIDFNLGFGPQPGNLIRNNIDNASCLDYCCDPTVLPGMTLTSNCDNENFSVSGVADQQGSEGHWWGLYETTVQGSTSGTDTIDGDPDTNDIDPVAPVQWGYTALFENLDLSKHYYIKHGIWQDGCFTWKETLTPVEEFEGTAAFHFENENGSSQNTFCLGEEIYLDGQASEGENRYYIDVWRRPTGSSSNFISYGVLGWTLNQEVGVINLSEEFANLNIPTYFDPGYEYEIKLAIANLEDCIGWTPVTHRFTVVCCNDTIDPGFNIGLTTSGILQGAPFEEYSFIDANHEWYLFSSPEPSGGTYTFVDFKDDENYAFTPVEDELFYFLIHKLITDCGEFCYAQSICRNCLAPCDICGPVDCSIMDDLITTCDNMPTPSGLEQNIFTLTWDPMPGAIGYVVRSQEASDDLGIECRECENVINIPPVQVPTNSYLIPIDYRNYCFTWKVRAICSDNSLSEWSRPTCYIPKKEKGLEPTEESGSGLAKDIEIISLSPNPSDGMVNINIKSNRKIDMTVEVQDFYGVHIKRMTTSLETGITNSISWNGRGILKTGMYFVKFTAADEVIIKKLVVE